MKKLNTHKFAILLMVACVVPSMMTLTACRDKKVAVTEADDEYVGADTGNGGPIAPVERRSNLIQNGSFEKADATSETLPAAWTFAMSDVGEPIKLFPRQGHDGEGNALLLAEPETAITQAMSMSAVAQLQGTFARVRIWAKAEQGTPKLSMNLVETSNDSTVVWNVAAPPPNDENLNELDAMADKTGNVPTRWVKFENVFPIGKEASSIMLAIGLNPNNNPETTNTSVLLDNIQVYKTDSPMVVK